MNSILQIIGKADRNLHRLFEYVPVNYPLQEYLQVWGENRLGIQSSLESFDFLDYVLTQFFVR